MTGLCAIYRTGENRIIAFACFELIPKRAHLGALIFRQKGKKTISGGDFLGFFPGGIMGAVDRRVACVDFDKIMQKKHTDHPVDIHRAVGMFGKDHRIKRNMPAMFRRVFPPRQIKKL